MVSSFGMQPFVQNWKGAKRRLKKAPQRRPEEREDMQLEEVAKAVGGGYCRFQMPLKPALAVRETAAGHRLGALEGGGDSPLSMHPWWGVPDCLYSPNDQRL